MVELVGNFLHIVLAQRLEVTFFRTILPHQTVGVFVQAALPRSIRMSKIVVGLQPSSYLLMPGELFAVIASEGVNPRCQRPQLLDDRRPHGGGSGLLDLFKQGETRKPLGSTRRWPADGLLMAC